MDEIFAVGKCEGVCDAFCRGRVSRLTGGEMPLLHGSPTDIVYFIITGAYLILSAVCVIIQTGKCGDRHLPFRQKKTPGRFQLPGVFHAVAALE